MRWLLTSFIITVTFCEAAADDPLSISASDRFQAIEVAYDHELSQLETAPPPQRLAVAGRRNALLTKLLDEYRERNLDVLSTADLIALAKSAEYLERHHEALQYARLAISRSPDEPAPYIPLVRTLLDLDRTDEASGILTEIWERFDHASDVHDLNGFLYLKYKASGSTAEAARHIERLFDHYLAAIEQSPDWTMWAMAHLEAFVDAMIESRQQDRLVANLNRYRKMLAAKLGDSNFRLDAAASTAEWTDRSSLLKFDCELARFLSAQEATAAQLRWLSELASAAAERPTDPNIARAWTEAVTYVLEYSYLANESLLKEIRNLTRFVDEARTDENEDAAARNHFLRQLAELEQRILEQVTQSRNIVGRTIGNFDDLNWVNEQLALNQPVLICFWNPWRPPDFEVLRELNSIKSKQSADRPAIAAIAVYSGLEWDANKVNVVRTQNVDTEKECDAMAHLLKVAQIDVPCALIPASAEWARTFNRDDGPVTILLDRNGTIHWVHIGASAAGLRYATRELEQTIGH